MLPFQNRYFWGLTTESIDLIKTIMAAVEMSETQSHQRAAIKQQIDELYNSHSKLLKIWLRPRVLKSDIEDIAQDVWAKIVSKYEDSFDGANFRAWMLTIARNHLIDRSRRRKEMTSGEDSPLNEIVTKDLHPLQILLNQERKERLSNCLDGLSAVRRRVVQARLSGLNYNQISEVIGLEREQAHAHFFAAKKILNHCVNSDRRGF